MAKKSKRYEEPDEEEEYRERRPAKRRSGSWLFWLVSRLIVVVILLAALAYFAPIVISSTGLWKSLVATAAPQLAGKVDATSLSLSWFAPVEIRGLVVRDAEGGPLVEVPQIKSHKTLLELAINHNDLGTFEVADLKAKIVLRAEGSNVEDLLAKMPKSEKGQSGELPQFGLSLVRGSVLIDDQVARRQWQIDGIVVDLAWTATGQAKTGKVAAAIRPVEPAGQITAGGQLAADFSWNPGVGQPPSMGAGQTQVALQDLPTDILRGALRRLAHGIEPAGPLTLQASYSWGDDGNSHRALVNTLTTPGLRVTAPALIGEDQPILTIASGQADVQISGSQVTVKSLKLDSNLVQLAGAGAGSLPVVASATPKPVNYVASASDIQLNGALDLAELARQLPRTLALRAGANISSGQVQFSLASRDQPTGRGWEADLRTANLQATAGGRPVRFDQPLNISLLLRQANGGFEIERLIGKASFLNLEGSGALAKGLISAEADLNQLATELKQLVDFGNTRLAGTLDGKLQWSQGDGDRWSATAAAQVRKFELAASGLAPWQEQDLRLSAETQGIVRGGSLTQIDSADLAIEAGQDRLAIELLEPVTAPSARAKWPVKFSLRGDLETWTPRLQPVLTLGDLRLAGAIDVNGSGRFSTSATELSPTKIQIEQLAVSGAGLAIREPIVRIETSGSWNQTERTLTLPSATFASSALAFRADDIRVVAGTEPSLVGLIDLRGDLAKLSSWRAVSTESPGMQLSGALSGRLEIGYRGKSLSGGWTAEVERFACLAQSATPSASNQAALASASAAPAWEPVWEEPRINFAGQAAFDPATATLSIDRASLAGSVASLSATGLVSKLTSLPEVDLSGEIAYNLDAITQQIVNSAQRRAATSGRTSTLGLDTLQLVGKEQRQFKLKGPLFAAVSNLTPAGRSPAPGSEPVGVQISEALAGEASFGWQGAQYVGLIAGPANVRARLAGGNVDIGPLDIPISEGRLTMAPRLLLNASNPGLVIGRGPLIENVRISPEMCNLWLKFVAPMLAEATRAEGTFSVSLQGAAVPLAKPDAAEVAGTLAIQSAQVGPGPVAQQFLATARQLRLLIDPNAEALVDPNAGWLILPKQDVLFEVRDGAVLHRGLTFTVRDVTITTEGSVNIESQALNLIAEIPLQESWFKDRRVALLKGKTLRIPVGGTLTQPRIEARILDDLGKQLLGSALQGFLDRPGGLLNRQEGMPDQPVERGQGVLQRELGKGLDRLFGPRQPQPAPVAPQP